MTRILIIDDEYVARETLDALLAGEDFTLDFAIDGPSGIAQAKAATPDIILLDLMLPGMNGFEVCTRLRADPDLAEIPILMITAYADRKSRLRGLSSGADEFIVKPFDGLELLTRLRTLARLNRYRRLTEERERMRWVLEHSADGYIVVDAAGMLTYANAPARLFLGIEVVEEEPAQRFVDIAAHTYQLEPATAWAAWPDSRLRESCYLVRPETATAQAFWLSVSEQRFEGREAPQIVLQLRDATELVSARREMRSFRTALTHKLRTPMNAIVGMLGLLLDFPDETTVGEVREMLTDAYDGAQRLNSVVEDVLTYVGGVSAQKGSAETPLAALPEIVRSVGAMLSLNDISLTIDDAAASMHLPLSTSVSEQLFFELLENSKKFHPEGDPSVTISVSNAADGVHILVADDGVSLSPQQIKWAMSPYMQGEKFFTGETPGMGLGLTLVSALMWQAGGSIQLCNRVDCPGVIVDLRIPTKEMQSA